MLERKLKLLEHEQEFSNGRLENTKEQIRLVKHEIKEIVKLSTSGALVRSRAKWAYEGERPTKYFLNLERKRAVSKTLVRLKNKNDEIIDSGDEILQEINDFYKKLYTTKGEIDTSFMENLIIPKLPDNWKVEMDKPLNLHELSLALKSMKNNKSPGLDGFPADFWKVFWVKVKFLYEEVIQESVMDGELHQMAREGVLSLLEKVGKDILNLKNWHPLTLLNVDNKIYSKALATRLQKTQQLLICEEQTGFVKGRHLATNIVKILGVIEKCEEGQKGVLISFDFEKAFDTVEWEMIFHTLHLFGFGDPFIHMVEVLFCNPRFCTANNGNISGFETPTRECRQGCCFSPIIFTYVVEILGLAIRQSQDITGLKVGDTEIKSGQFADDLWTTLKAEEHNINNMLKLLFHFQKYSGLAINPDKSSVLKLGPWKDSNAKFYTLKRLYWSPGAINILGFKICHNYYDLMAENFDYLISKAENILDVWQDRNTGRERLIRSHSSARFSFELSENSN